jgi:hypothetical protein
VTDVNVNAGQDGDDEDIFQNSSDDFPSKFHLRDRLVMIYPTDKAGTRQGENGPYQWMETTTVVLDDGPQGWQPEVMNFETNTMVPNLVPSVAEEGPQVLENFQWSAGGVVSRLQGKQPAKNGGKPVGLLGRIDAKAQKGKAAAWRPNPPTEADQARALEPDIKAARLAARDAIRDAYKAEHEDDNF